KSKLRPKAKEDVGNHSQSKPEEEIKRPLVLDAVPEGREGRKNEQSCPHAARQNQDAGDGRAGSAVGTLRDETNPHANPDERINVGRQQHYFRATKRDPEVVPR